MLRWLSRVPQDKLLHFITGAGLFWGLALVVPGLFAMLGVALAGGLKEAYDYLNRDKHTPEGWDALATSLGGLGAYILVLTV